MFISNHKIIPINGIHLNILSSIQEVRVSSWMMCVKQPLFSSSTIKEHNHEIIKLQKYNSINVNDSLRS